MEYDCGLQCGNSYPQAYKLIAVANGTAIVIAPGGGTGFVY
jgi:hypothetical protein